MQTKCRLNGRQSPRPYRAVVIVCVALGASTDRKMSAGDGVNPPEIANTVRRSLVAIRFPSVPQQTAEASGDIAAKKKSDHIEREGLVIAKGVVLVPPDATPAGDDIDVSITHHGNEYAGRLMRDNKLGFAIVSVPDLPTPPIANADDDTFQGLVGKRVLAISFDSPTVQLCTRGLIAAEFKAEIGGTESRAVQIDHSLGGSLPPGVIFDARARIIAVRTSKSIVVFGRRVDKAIDVREVGASIAELLKAEHRAGKRP